MKNNCFTEIKLILERKYSEIYGEFLRSESYEKLKELIKSKEKEEYYDKFVNISQFYMNLIRRKNN